MLNYCYAIGASNSVATELQWIHEILQLFLFSMYTETLFEDTSCNVLLTRIRGIDIIDNLFQFLFSRGFIYFLIRQVCWGNWEIYILTYQVKIVN